MSTDGTVWAGRSIRNLAESLLWRTAGIIFSATWVSLHLKRESRFWHKNRPLVSWASKELSTRSASDLSLATAAYWNGSLRCANTSASRAKLVSFTNQKVPRMSQVSILPRQPGMLWNSASRTPTEHTSTTVIITTCAQLGMKRCH